MPEPLKHIYSETFIHLLGKSIYELNPSFDLQHFYERVFDEDWKDRTLKQRMRHITLSLHQSFCLEYQEIIQILSKIIPLFKDHELASIVFPDYVEVYGLDDWGTSIPALELFTQYTTSEFAVRPFLKKNLSNMIQQMYNWSHHRNHRVRRLASEGCRPRLPWGMAIPQLKESPQILIPILAELKQDESKYVRTSVANHLNDISKDHPELVLSLTKEWLGTHPYTDQILKHACRTLLKKGDSIALSLFGFKTLQGVSVHDFSLSQTKLSIGESFQFVCKITSHGHQSQQIRIEYAIDFVKSKGHSTPKKFKIGEKQISPDETIQISKKHSFHDLTTRKHYPGNHSIAIFINGIEMARQSFQLTL